MENKNFFNLQTTVLAFINSGKDGNMAPKEINGTLCFKVAANSGPRGEDGKFKYPAKWVQIYVKNENLKAITTLKFLKLKIKFTIIVIIVNLLFWVL